MSRFASKTFIVALSLAVALAAISSFAHGWLDGRWVSKPDVEAIGAKLKELPTQIGDWSLVENQQLSQSALSMLQCYGHTMQVYQNSKTGRRVNVAVLFGPRGPIAVHTPEICYSGQGMTPAKTTQEKIEADGVDHTIWHVNLKSKRDEKPSLEAYYAWSDGGSWQAAEFPRVWLTGRLYKIQLACEPPQSGQTPDAELFLQQFLPKLQRLLVPE